MTETDIAKALANPAALLQLSALLLLLLTVAVAALTSIITVNVMAGRITRSAAAPPVVAAPAPLAAAPAQPGIDSAVIAAISAAVCATVGCHRLVYVGEAPRASGWTSSARLRHHTSHMPNS